MLHLDRYLALTGSRAIDLATGRRVAIEQPDPARAGAGASGERPLFAARQGRLLIDAAAVAGERIEIWERVRVRHLPGALEPAVLAFAEMLECARHGIPRLFDVTGRRARDQACLVRLFAREARLRGWVPIALPVLAHLAHGMRRGLPAWLTDRSLVIFTAQRICTAEEEALWRVARSDTRPHVIIRTLVRETTGNAGAAAAARRAPGTVVHEAQDSYGATAEGTAGCDLAGESAARWGWLIAGLTDRTRQPARAIALAGVLGARGQSFEARALLASVPREPSGLVSRAHAIAVTLAGRARARAAHRLSGTAAGTEGHQMVDDFVDVLRICQDIEDEQAALSRVGAFLRDRLQAASVAFLVREGAAPRVLARVGSEAAGLAVAIRSMETGVPVGPGADQGPVESAWPVRYAADVIGAVWCRWSAGTPVAPQHASALLGIAATATAPSLRLAIARTQPIAGRDNPVPELVGHSPAIVEVRDAIVRAAASPFPVVIEGESGSGKELAARAIHARSGRRDRRFCAINCAALVDDLVEAELFGHVRGAFTGAATDHAGMFEDASGGTLFLDEVAELGGRVQAKLLRTLQEGEIRRVGETVVRKVDVRVVAATNRPLAAEVAAGRFRADLWYRLDVVRLALPALRDRLEDLPALVDHLWRLLAARTGSRAALSAAAVASLAAYGWPGNIRELQNVLASMLVSAPRTGLIGASALPLHIARAAALERGATLADARRQFDERYVRAALAKAGGRTTPAARALGLSRQGLTKLMGRLGIADARREIAPSTHVQ